MTNTLYNDTQGLCYVALVHELRIFKQWCSRWQIDPDEITVVTPAYFGIEQKVMTIYSLDYYGLILLEGWETVRDTHSGWSKRLFDQAKYILDTNLVRPETVAGLIINWKKIGEHKGRKPKKYTWKMKVLP